MINVQKYKKRLLDLEKKLSKQTDRDVEDAREDLIDTPGDAGDKSVSDVAVDSEFTQAELNSIILHLNDDHLWTREQIVAWLKKD